MKAEAVKAARASETYNVVTKLILVQQHSSGSALQHQCNSTLNECRHSVLLGLLGRLYTGSPYQPTVEPENILKSMSTPGTGVEAKKELFVHLGIVQEDKKGQLNSATEAPRSGF